MHDKLQKTKQKLKDFRTKQKTATATDWKKITQTTSSGSGVRDFIFLIAKI